MKSKIVYPMSVLIRFTLPSRYGAVAGFAAGKTIPVTLRRQVGDKIQALVLAKCGGFSALSGYGVWQDDQGKKVREKITILESVVTFVSEKDQDDFIACVSSTIKRELRQDAVLSQVLPVTAFWA